MQEPIHNNDAAGEGVEIAPRSAGAPAGATAADLRQDGSYRAVMFDLDGTLLPMDLDGFLNAYFTTVIQFMAKRGIDPQAFKAAFDAGVKSMMRHDAAVTNYTAFWDAFFSQADEGAHDWIALFTEYYETDFDRIGDTVAPNPAAGKLVRALADKGYPLVLATTPLFPLLAVEKRVKWAGVDIGLFSRVTNYENSTALKPSLTYYAENLAAAGVRGSDVLMIGNNTVEDYAFAELGADVYLAEDWLLNPNGFDYAPVPHGKLAELLAWADGLAPCANPAGAIETGLVGAEARDRALAENKREGER